MSNNLVIVESPAKAATIEKILGKGFKVVSSYGHIRDLEKKNMGVDIANSFTPRYYVSDDKKTVLKSLIKESKNSDVIWLATDEDREGEAIAWHLYEVMNLKGRKVNRIVFHEITKNAIQSAIKKPRNIDINLVNAQQARRILDRIVGFKLSPILWKKVRSGLSAGRVQSVAVRLIVEKEKKIMGFVSNSTYKISGEFLTQSSEILYAKMLNDIKLKITAHELLKSFIKSEFKIDSIETKPSTSASSPPFTTSGLQQAASNRLGFSVSRTMSVAQKLYEVGYITYMRTDSTNLSKESLVNMQKYIIEKYGNQYSNTTTYSTKAKVAQEAHEAIRPTDIYKVNAGQDESQKKLYKLIWERTVCSQMSNAIIDKTTVSINVSNKEKSTFQAYGQIIKFDGYLIVQNQLLSNNKKDTFLPKLKVGETLEAETIIANEKHSKAPSRFTEASLVKKLEELGIGRPSTYAPTISVIQKREYVVKNDIEGQKKDHVNLILKNNSINEKVIPELIGSEKKKLIPTEIGKITNDFLVDNFNNVLDYNFTAKVENQFDDIACGKTSWKNMLQEFYTQFEPKLLDVDKNSSKVTGLRQLGIDPITKKNVYVRLGKYGPIVQIGELTEGGQKPKYAKLRRGQTIGEIDLKSALELFSLPRTVGKFENQDIIVSEGKYGPYARYGNSFVSLGELNPLTVDLTTCIEFIKTKRESEKQKIINSFIIKDLTIEIRKGKYGPYIKSGKKNYKIPKDLDPKELTKQDCLNLIEKSSKN